jgi:hypothetical protein
MNKFLIGGDSFSNPLPVHKIHWCKFLAEKHNAEPIFKGLGAADICSTSLIMAQELLKDQYEHAVFFVTQEYRTVINVDTDAFKHAEISCDEIYIDSLLEKRFCRTPDEESEYQLIGINHATTDDNAKIYFSLRSTYTYMHNFVSNLMMLDTIAKNKGTKILFVDIFNNIPNIFKENTESEIFNYFKLMGTTHFEYYNQPEQKEYKTLSSHHSIKDHKQILSLFEQQYPDWIST